VIRSIELVAIGIGVILSAAAVTIIANTIRLTLFARRDEIAILRLIGATTIFIRVPYLMEGAVLGALGSTLSLVMLKFMYELFRQQMRTTGRFAGLDNLIAFFPPSVCLALVAVGMGLGVAGSFVSIRRFGEAKA
jgi:cell division transport system permease protein